MKNTINMIRICLLLIFFSAYNLYSGNNQVTTETLANMKSSGYFMENKGQIIHQDGSKADEIRYLYVGPGLKVQIKNNSFSYELYRNEINSDESQKKDANNTKNEDDFTGTKQVDNHIIKINRIDVNLLNANNNPAIIAENPSEEYYNFYTQNTPLEGITGVRKFGRISLIDIYDGIDLVFYIDNSSNTPKIKYDFVVNPGADLSNIKMKYQGADNISINTSGELVLTTALGNIKENIPLAFYRDFNGITYKSDASFDLTGDIVQFKNTENKNDKTLIVDPELYWGTYFGGKGRDEINDITVDSKDFIYATGNTDSDNKIATSGAFQTSRVADWDVFLAKFNNQGRLVWATYYGDSGMDMGQMVISTKQDSLIIAGYTRSIDGMSTPGSYQPTFGGGVSDGFVAKFNSNGQRLWGTYYGGSEFDEVYAISMDSSYNVIIGGTTQSSDGIATNDGFQNYKEGIKDGFVVKFDSSMNRVWATYFGGSELGSGANEKVVFITADRAGNIYITGFTPCNFSVANDKGFQQAYGGGSYDGFLAKLYPTGALHWSTYVGGSNEDIPRCIASFGNGNLFLIGSTKSLNNIASSDAHQKTSGGLWDAFIAKFDVYGDRKWATYYGGSEDDFGTKISKYGFDQMIAMGYTSSTSGIANSEGPNIAYNDTIDAFLTRFNTSGQRIWGTYYGGRINEVNQYGGLTFDKKGNVIFGGSTQSAVGISTPNTNPHQPVFEGDSLWGEEGLGGYYTDAYIAMIGIRITINNFNKTFCQGSIIDVPYSIALDFNSDNVFTLELSDANGDFTNPVEIGTENDKTTGWINAVIPLNTPPGDGYRVRIKASSPENTSKDNGFDFEVAPLPEPVITGTTEVCSKNTYDYSVNSAAGYENDWSIVNGKFVGDSTSSTVRIKWDDVVQGKIKVIQTVSQTGCIDSTESDIEIIISPDPSINGKTTVAAYASEFYSTPALSKLEYDWLVTGGAIQGIDDDNRIEIKWSGPGVGTIRLLLTDNKTECSDSLKINVTINSSPIQISGKQVVCANSSEKYSVITGAGKSNLWSATGGELDGVDNDSVVTIMWANPGDGFVQLIQTDNGTQKKDTVIQKVDIIPQPEIGILGLDELCESVTEIYYANITENRSSKWSVYNGEILNLTNGDSIIVKWNSISDDEDSIFVKASVTLEQTDLTTGCSNIKTRIINMSKNPSAQFFGKTNVCSGRVETYTVKETNAVINEWYITGGTVIGSSSDSTVQIEWGNTGVGKIKLIQKSNTLCSDSSLTDIIINSVPERPSVTQSGKVLYSSSEIGNQWFFNSLKIDGATNQLLIPDKSGYYTVHVISPKGCESDLSQPYYFDINNIVESISSLGIKIYPNPADDILYIDFGTNFYNTNKIKIIDAIGKSVFTGNLKLNDLNKYKLDFTNFAAGVYVVEIEIDGKLYHDMIIKK